MKNAVKITVEQLKEMLLNWNYGAQPVSVQYLVVPDWAKNEYKDTYTNVRKFAHVGGMIGYVYQNSVNNQLEREGKEREFISKPLWNGAGLRINSVLSTHKAKGTFYMTFKQQTTYRSLYFDLVDFVAYSNKFMRNFLKPFKAPTNQGVVEGKEIFHREISLENITKLKMRKVTYVIQK